MWRFFEQVAVRTTGFPVALYEQFHHETLGEDLRRIVHADRELDHVSVALEDGYARATSTCDRAQLREVRRARRRVAAGALVPSETIEALPDPLADHARAWNAARESVDRATSRGRATFGTALQQSRSLLRETVRRDDVQEALFLLSPPVLEAANRYVSRPTDQPRTSRVREVERRLATYLQRLCTKNETNSFFGPVNYGRIDGAAADNLTVRLHTRRLTERAVFPSHWMVQALADTMAAEPQLHPFLQPRAIETVPPPCADAFDEAVLARCSGHTRLGEIADTLEVGFSRVWASVRRLSAARLIVHGPVVPADICDPLTWLIDWIGQLPSDCPSRSAWMLTLTGIRDLMAEFADASLPRRQILLDRIQDAFETASGRPAARSGGQMYADRGVLFEECRGNLADLVIGHRLARDMTVRLTPVLALARTYGILRWERDQAQARARWATLPGHESVPASAYYESMSHDDGSTVPQDPEDALARFERDLADIVRARAVDGVAVLDAADLPPTLPGPAEQVDLTSLDLMVDARDADAVAAGEYRVIVGEMHPQPLLWVFPTGHFMTDAQRRGLEQDLDVALTRQSGAGIATTIAHTRSSKVYPYRLPGRMVELRPRLPNAGAPSLATVRIRRRADGSVCWWHPEAGWLRLYAPLRRRPEHDPIAPFAFPAVTLPTIDTGTFTPRVEIDGVVVQRKRWRLPATEFRQPHTRAADEFRQHLAVWRVKSRHGLPDRVYVKVAGEAKPVYVDFTNVFSVELLESLARANDTLICTEALPDPGRAWFDTGTGAHTCEFRTVAWSPS